MTPHIEAKKGDYAPTVLLPGDPLRAQWIAETFFDDARQVNAVRNMFGFTGSYKGMPVSVQGTGMGMPSCSIYIHELLETYGCKTLIRVGTCGGLQKDLDVGSVILGVAASTDSRMNQDRFDGKDFAPHADLDLMVAAKIVAAETGQELQSGGIISNDVFYADTGVDHLKKFIEYGVLAVEMEANALYSLAAKFRAKALAICTVSDNLITEASWPPEERQTGVANMVKLALETAKRCQDQQ